MRACTIAVVLLLAGCSWGHRERLAYDALAREAIDTQIATTADIVADKLVTFHARAVEQEHEPNKEFATGLLARCAEIKRLSEEGAGRARVLQLYYGAPPEIPVDLDSPKDNSEVVSMAGLAAARKARREFPEKFIENVAKFGARSVARASTAIVTEIQSVIPGWLWFLLIVAGLTIGGISVYSFYVRMVILPQKHAELEQHRRELCMKEAALDEYDDAIELLEPDRIRRADIAKGLHLKREHVERNERRRRERANRPTTLHELRVPVHCHERTPEGGVPSAPEMLPGLTDKTVPPGGG